MLTVSVVIPTYNCQQYLAKAITSAIHPSVIEIIVIDDGSTDETAAVVKEVRQSLLQQGVGSDVLRYIKQPNQGVSAARNHGIEIASGELIAFLDADDCFLPNKLSCQIACFEADATLDIVQSGWQRVDTHGELLEVVSPWITSPELTLENFLRFKPILPSALLVRRKCLLNTKFDPELAAAEDVDLMSRLLLAGCRAEWVKEALVSYRQHGHNAMGNSLTQARDLNKFLDKFFGQQTLPEHVRMQERAVRYYTLVWAACCLQRTGHFKEMAQELRQAWHHTPHLPAEAVIYWMDSFEKFGFQQEGEGLRALLASQDWQALVSWILVQKSCSAKNEREA